MLGVEFIRSNPDEVRQALSFRGASESVNLVDEVLEQDRILREALTLQQAKQQEINSASRTVGTLMREGNKEAAADLIQRQKILKADVKELGQTVTDSEEQLSKLLLAIPNIPHESVPEGLTEAENVTIHRHGELPSFDFEPLPHWTISDRHGMIDFERGAKVAGAGFPFYMDVGAKLHRALINFFLSAATPQYTEVRPPLFVNAASAQGTGQLPDKEGQMYFIEDGFFPVPTAEVPLTNYFRDEILSEADLPIKLCAHTPCWRREAGSYGAHVRGLNRLHQFDKVEIVQFTHPHASYDVLEAMRLHAEELLKALELPYRCLLMCAGELGFNQTKQYDLEVWSAGQKRWLEVSSISNFTDYQARRMNIRFRPDGGGKPQLVHTLNGSALALPRVVAALLEHNQKEDGSHEFPSALTPYLT
ncbi:MAG: serine--tRNA ligase [Rhodothermaceae bacterium]|nr:serine--tRNA ligase [Rhodothermaceae bacterium]MXZ58895.1 serine--tRNA ligase [Rhodothermaceae bacterium]MYB90019.1 serine--tRNA ligase [Rhodothermaceae bacterium]MYD68417.1 serine--tRNA ligase [Rhodothermaceae bacterium]MYG43760.1 serine--tRNA ligase [Rhodothermaceae bacterium]